MLNRHKTSNFLYLLLFSSILKFTLAQENASNSPSIGIENQKTEELEATTTITSNVKNDQLFNLNTTTVVSTTDSVTLGSTQTQSTLNQTEKNEEFATTVNTTLSTRLLPSPNSTDGTNNLEDLSISATQYSVKETTTISMVDPPVFINNVTLNISEDKSDFTKEDMTKEPTKRTIIKDATYVSTEKTKPMTESSIKEATITPVNIHLSNVTKAPPEEKTTTNTEIADKKTPTTEETHIDQITVTELETTINNQTSSGHPFMDDNQDNISVSTTEEPMLNDETKPPYLFTTQFSIVRETTEVSTQIYTEGTKENANFPESAINTVTAPTPVSVSTKYDTNETEMALNQSIETSTMSEPTTTEKNINLVQVQLHVEDLDQRQGKGLNPEEPYGGLSTNSCMCDDNITGSIDETSCLGNRVLFNPDCSCRKLCFGQSGQTCSSSRPCDTEFGLYCNPDIYICQGHIFIQTQEVTPGSITIQWKAEFANATVTYSTSYERINATNWMSVETQDSLAQIRGLTPHTEYFIRVSVGDKHEIVVLKTKDAPVDNVPKILVTHRTPSSFTLAWDDFKLPNYQAGYIVEYRIKEGVDGKPGEWIQIQGTNFPLLSISRLRPQTAYQARVSVWEDEKIGTYSEVVTVFTEDGCVENNQTVKVGQEYFKGCEQRCLCKGNNTDDCQDRCGAPFISIDEAKKKNSSCFLNSSPDDSCCVKVTCTHELTDVVEPSASEGSLEDEAMITDRTDNDTMMGDQYTLSVKEYEVKQDEKLPTNQSSTDITFTPKLVAETDGETVTATILPFLGNDSGALDTDNETSDMPLMTPEEVTSEMNSTSVLKLKLPRLLDGCQFKNHTYEIGEKFHDGCEAFCHCEDVGRISCLPRCSLQDTSGHTCKQVPDPSDPCCYIVECTPSEIHSIDVKALPIEIKSVEPKNATTARVSFLMMSHHDKPLESKVQLWIAQVPESNDSALSWTKRIYDMNNMLATGPHTYNINVSSLMPNTEYYLKVMKVPVEGLTQQVSDDALFSNTVTVKTYPLEVKKTFQGCFHGNRSYEIGEMFYDGCEYKCICREGGVFECQDRCEVYIDTIGYEHCKWGPAADDFCCTVPYCNEPTHAQDTAVSRSSTLAPPSATTCKGTRGESRAVGEVWVEENDCKKKICNCEIHKNGSTVVRCKQGCPSISKKDLQSSPNCPFPILITPNDNPCLCPYVFCTNSFNPLQPTVMGCTFKGNHYKVGEEFHDECRSLCHCGADLEVNCALIECPHHFPPHVTECLEWHIDPNFQPIPPNCCPPPKCKNDGSCRFNGIKINNFQRIPDELLDCGTRCVCVNGNVTCENRCPPLGNIPPPNLPCPPALAYKGHLPGDTCCVHWICREPHASGRTLENVNIVALNGTTVRVRFTLPSLLVGLVGHAELHYTTNPTIPRPAWLVQKFARPQRLFDTSNIEYYMTKLRPGTTYFFQIRVIMEALRGGPESEVYKLTLPEIFIPPSTTPQSITTTREEKMKLTLLSTEQSVETTTLPSLLVLDTNMKVDSIKTNSVNVSWRMFQPKEMKFIDGLLLKYKLKDEANSEWKKTPIIHREVTSYKIRDLQPSTSYMIEMEFKLLPDVPTHVMSNTPMEVKTLPQVTEETMFHTALHLDNVGPHSTNLSLSGLPTPHEKHIHVVKLVYRNQSDFSEHYVFKIPEDHLTLDKLRPASRYKIWAEVFLINGKTITTNTLDITTKVDYPSLSSSDNSSEQIIVNDPEALQENQNNTNTHNRAYYVALIIVAIVAGVTGLGFIILLILLMKKQSSAKAPISKAPSKTDYDNPTFKSYDSEGLEQKNENGQA